MLKTRTKEQEPKSSNDLFTTSMVAAATSTCLLHFFLASFYLIIEVPEMVVYSAVTVFLFLLWRKLFKKKFFKIPFILGSINVGVGIIMANYFIGWESNFNIYFIVLPAGLMLYRGWKKWEKGLYLTLVVSLYILLFVTVSDFSGIYTINSEIIKYLSITNALTSCTILIIILSLFSDSILEMRYSLEQKNKHLENKTNDLNDSLIKEQELGKLKTNFVSTASHQFRTPLAAIQSNSELLHILSKDINQETSKRYKKVTDRITGEIGKMTELMDDVLILGKLTSGNVDFKPQEIDLVHFCKKLVQEFNDMQTDGRNMDFVIEGEPYSVYLDPRLLTHSLSNLFSNAFKYSLGKENPKLTVFYRLKEFQLTIEDCGIGIPKGEMPSLFQPFFRANNVTEIKGTGLGLSIAQEYIEVNKGRLTASSTEEIGSSFKISFKKE